MPQIRDEFAAIVSGWTLTSDVEDLGEKLEDAARWAERNAPLLPAEDATLKMMVQTQVARGVYRGDFEPFIRGGCPHSRLDEDGICRRCGEDCTGRSI